MPDQIRAIAANAFTEAIRQPVYAVLVLAVSLLIVINPLFSAYTLDDDNMLLLDLGLSTLFLGGLLLSASTATGVLSREIANRTILTLMSKPLSRTALLAGKYLGVLAALACAEWIWAQFFLLTIRHRVMMRATDVYDIPVILFGLVGFLGAVGFAVRRNFARRRAFSAELARALAIAMPIALLAAFGFDKQWTPQLPLVEFDPQILLALLLLFEGVAILCALAVMVSTRLGEIGTLVFCAALFLLGLTSNYFFGARLDESLPARVAYALVPNLQCLWLADALTQAHPVSLGTIGLATGYSGLYIAGVLALAVALFGTREFG